jgi:hypothetical protein
MTDTLTTGDKEVSARGRFRDICENATMFTPTFDTTDAVDVVISAVVAKLRADPRMPKLTLNQWDEILRDPMLDAEDFGTASKRICQHQRCDRRDRRRPCRGNGRLSPHHHHQPRGREHGEPLSNTLHDHWTRCRD